MFWVLRWRCPPYSTTFAKRRQKRTDVRGIHVPGDYSALLLQTEVPSAHSKHIKCVMCGKKVVVDCWRESPKHRRYHTACWDKHCTGVVENPIYFRDPRAFLSFCTPRTCGACNAPGLRPLPSGSTMEGCICAKEDKLGHPLFGLIHSRCNCSEFQAPSERRLLLNPLAFGQQL